MSWVPVGDRQRCTIHDKTFGRLEQCADCARMRTRPALVDLTDDAPAEAPSGCMSADERERILTELALYATTESRALMHGETSDRNAAIKLLDVAVKAHRAAGELTRTRERKDYVRRLEATVRRLKGGGRN